MVSVFDSIGELNIQVPQTVQPVNYGGNTGDFFTSDGKPKTGLNAIMDGEYKMGAAEYFLASAAVLAVVVFAYKMKGG